MKLEYTYTENTQNEIERLCQRQSIVQVYEQICMVRYAEWNLKVYLYEIFELCFLLIKSTLLEQWFLPQIIFEYKFEFAEIFKWEGHSANIQNTRRQFFFWQATVKWIISCSLLIYDPVVHLNTVF
jgi:hypothetical protein